MPTTILFMLTIAFSATGLALILASCIGKTYATGTPSLLRSRALGKLGSCLILTSAATYAASGELHPVFGLLATAMALAFLFQFSSASRKLINHLNAENPPAP